MELGVKFLPLVFEEGTARLDTSPHTLVGAALPSGATHHPLIVQESLT